jgi:hypothetical protein
MVWLRLIGDSGCSVGERRSSVGENGFRQISADGVSLIDAGWMHDPRKSACIRSPLTACPDGG